MKRPFQITFVIAFLLLSWLLMQVVHEAGHVIAAWMSGGVVENVILHPLQISRTDFAINPKPLLVVWSGPVLGCLFPILLSGFFRIKENSYRYLLDGFTGFCLVANGIYLAAGAFDSFGDGGDILRYGGTRIQLIIFGLIGVPSGLFLWHTVSTHFGFGDRKGMVENSHCIACVLILGFVVLIEVALARQISL